MTRNADWLSFAAIGLAVVCALAYLDWLFLAPTYVLGPNDRQSGLLLGSSMLVDHPDPRGVRFEVFSFLRTSLAVVGLATSVLGGLVFLKAGDSLPARLVGWMLVGSAMFTFVPDFLCVDARYQPLSPGRELRIGLSTVLYVWLAALIARFLVVFPRPVDGDSVMECFWYRKLRRQRGKNEDGVLGTWDRWRMRLDDPTARSIVLLPWHRSLVNGRMVWIMPVGAALLISAGAFLEGASSREWMGGIGGVIAILLVGWFLMQGLPFAFASTTHLHLNGSKEDRRRVAWLRAVFLGFGVLVLALFVVRLLKPLGIQLPDWLGPRFGAGLLLFAINLPVLLVLGLTFAVLYDGSLDPRIAVTRVTVWTILGVGMTLAFLLLERFIAAKVIGWLSLPPDSGAIMAGGIIAGTFVPIRRFTERTVTRLAERYLPLDIVADGVRVVKTVMVSDISGYTALSATDEQRALLLGALLKRQAERIVGNHGGNLVKTMGDAVMVSFESNDGAIAAALELHRMFPLAADAVGVEPLPLHTALNRGEIVESHDGDIYGQTVNVTARLVDAAGVHEIVLSDTVKEGLTIAPSFTDLGPRKFKNVPAPVPCFRIEGAGAEPE